MSQRLYKINFKCLQTQIAKSIKEKWKSFPIIFLESGRNTLERLEFLSNKLNTTDDNRIQLNLKLSFINSWIKWCSDSFTSIIFFCDFNFHLNVTSNCAENSIFLLLQMTISQAFISTINEWKSFLFKKFEQKNIYYEKGIMFYSSFFYNENRYCFFLMRFHSTIAPDHDNGIW